MDKIRAARFRAMNIAPYFSHVLAAMPLVRSESLPWPMGVDKWGRCFYHPAVEKLDLDTIAAIFLHEASHLLRTHWRRQNGRNDTVVVVQMAVDGDRVVAKAAPAQLWNIACDIAINPDLQEMLGRRLEGMLLPETFDLPPGLSAEEYYDLLRQRIAPQDGGDGDDEEQEGKIELETPIFGGHPDPSAEDGNLEREAERQGARRLSELEQKLIAHRTAQEILRHEKTRGDIPAGLKRWAKTVLSPKLPWRTILRSTVRLAIQGAVAGKVDYTWKRPSRREAALGGEIRLPGLMMPLPRVGVAIDTSGSMSEGELEMALAEVGGILREVRAKVWVVSGDTKPHTEQLVYDPREVELVGGGGTDMRALIRALARVQPPLDTIVVITDGYTPWPKRKPRHIHSVIVVLTDPDGTSPSWARTVVIDEGG